MKRRFGMGAIALSLIALTWVSCDKKDEDKITDAYTVSGAASGAQERPIPVTATSGVATLTGSYKKSTKMLDYTITWTNLSDSVKGMHFHGPALNADSSAGVQIAIPGTPAPATGTVTNMATLTAEQEAQLLAGQWYYNLHTKNYPAGEIRGNISVSAQ